MIPPDPLEAVFRALAKLETAGVNYLAFIAQGHRVFFSLGETKMSPEKFIFAWCAALEAIGQLEQESVVHVADFNNVVVTTFVPFVKLAVFFVEKATPARVQGFVDEINRVKGELAGMFVSRDVSPHMPQGPKEGGRPRRLGSRP
jgi:hypothetical protein